MNNCVVIKLNDVVVNDNLQKMTRWETVEKNVQQSNVGVLAGFYIPVFIPAGERFSVLVEGSALNESEKGSLNVRDGIDSILIGTYTINKKVDFVHTKDIRLLYIGVPANAISSVGSYSVNVGRQNELEPTLVYRSSSVDLNDVYSVRLPFNNIPSFDKSKKYGIKISSDVNFVVETYPLYINGEYIKEVVHNGATYVDLGLYEEITDMYIFISESKYEGTGTVVGEIFDLSDYK